MKFNNLRKISYRRWDRRGNAVPAIILQGKFLEQFKFKLGQYVKVDYQPGQILISKNDSPSDPIIINSKAN